MQTDAGRDAHDAVRVVLRTDGSSDVTAVTVAVSLRAAGEAPELDHVQIRMRRVDPRVDHVRVDVRDRSGAVARERRAEVGVDLVDAPRQHLCGGGRDTVGDDIRHVLVGAQGCNAIVRDDGGIAVERDRPDVVDARSVPRRVQICHRT